MSHDFLLSLATIGRRFGRWPVRPSRLGRLIGQRCEVDPKGLSGNSRESLFRLLPPLGPFAILLRLSICFSERNGQPIWPGNCYAVGSTGKIRRHISNLGKGLLPESV